MSHAAGGRHRATQPSRRPTSHAVWTVVGSLLMAVGFGVFLLWPDGTPTATSPGALTSEEPSSDESPSLGAPAPTVQSSRDVTVDGPMITVEEVSTVLGGSSVRAAPATSVPLGLQLVNAWVVTPDGRSSSFDAPVTLDPAGSLTIRSRYRLTDCPDIIPTQWPSLSEFPDATRTYLRLEGPLHTAYALCPESGSRADSIQGLTGRLLPGVSPRIRLSWSGNEELSVSAVGSASGVAALVPEPSPGCEATCVLRLNAASSAALTLQPVDPCPPATTSDRLTLLVTRSDAAPSPVSVQVDGLHRAVCG